MLPHEIEPFAQAHMSALEAIRLQLEAVLADPEEVQALTPETLTIWTTHLKSSERAFYRFQVCLADEQATKNRYEAERREARLATTRQQ